MATYLVYAATGARGRPIAQGLLDRGHAVRALLPSARGRAALEAIGVEVFEGALEDARSLARASHGVDGVHLQLPVTMPPPSMLEAVRHAARAAAGGGAAAIVYTTGAPLLDGVEGGSLGATSAAAEELLAGPVPATVLMPTLYLANLAGPWTMPAILEHGVLPYPVPTDHPVAWLSPEDAAAFAIAALERTGARGYVLALAGAEAVTGPELAARIGAALGSPVRYAPIPAAEFEASLSGQVGPEAAADIARLYHLGEERGAGWLTPDLADTARLLGVEPGPIDAWVAVQPWLAGTPNRRSA